MDYLVSQTAGSIQGPLNYYHKLRFEEEQAGGSATSLATGPEYIFDLFVRGFFSPTSVKCLVTNSSSFWPPDIWGVPVEERRNVNYDIQRALA